MTSEQTMTLLDSMPAFRDALDQQASDAGLTATDANLLAIAMGKIDPVAKSNASAFGDLSGAAAEAKQSIEELAGETLNFGSAQIDAEHAAITFGEQIFALNERVAECVGGLDISTEAGQAIRQSLLEAETANKAASAALNAGEGQDMVNGKLSRGRQALIDAAAAYGMGEREAKSYADQVIAAPDTVTTWFRNNAEQAAAAVQVYKKTIDSIRDTVPTTIRVAMEQVGSIGGEKHATGGTVEYASGGTIGGISGLSALGIGGAS